MEESENYIDNFKKRRDFFHRNFPLKIGRQRTDVYSVDILKNSCPVCGYLTLDERDSFDICGICFWEDDGIDDFEENEESAPNRMTLKEGRSVFQKAKRELMITDHGVDKKLNFLKDNFLKLDTIIDKDTVDKAEVVRLQNEILDLLTRNKIYGLEKLFDH